MGYKLSVILITYNHDKYIELAMEGILNQETDFPFEVVVGDDCSTDRTRAIIEEMAREYPVHEPAGSSDRQVRFVPRDKNTGKPTLNVYETTMLCEGEYLAYLEGDDFWTDPHKLQKQVDFLENHPEYVATTHACRLVDENSDDITDPEVRKVVELYDWSGSYKYDDFCYSSKWPGHYATVVSRNIYKNNRLDYTILYRASDFTDDALILLFLLMQGDIYRMDDEMSAWRYIRKAGGTNWNSLAMKRDIAREDCYLSRTVMQWIEQYRPLGDYSVKRCLADFGLALKEYLKKPDSKNKQFLTDMYDPGIVHVVMKDKRTTLPGFVIKYLLYKCGLAKIG